MVVELLGEQQGNTESMGDPQGLEVVINCGTCGLACGFGPATQDGMVKPVVLGRTRRFTRGEASRRALPGSKAGEVGSLKSS